jgi:hypothetical protein
MAAHEVTAGAADAVRLDRATGRIAIHDPARGSSSNSSSSSSSSGGGAEGGEAGGEGGGGHLSVRPLAVDHGVNGRDEFTFNFVYPCDVETFEVYDDLVSPILHHVFLGFNGTVLCYGQTGRFESFLIVSFFIWGLK